LKKILPFLIGGLLLLFVLTRKSAASGTTGGPTGVSSSAPLTAAAKLASSKGGGSNTLGYVNTGLSLLDRLRNLFKGNKPQSTAKPPNFQKPGGGGGGGSGKGAKPYADKTTARNNEERLQVQEGYQIKDRLPDGSPVYGDY